MNRHPFLRFLLMPSLFLLGATATLCRAELSFETELIQHEAALDEEQFVAKFPFTNTGDSTITVIGNPRTSCGCTISTLEKKVYEPGDTGVVEATFTYGSRTGRQVKTITVSTDSGEYRVTLEVLIPSRWEVDPRIQTWRKGEDLSAKTFAITFDALKPTKVTLSSFPEDRYEATSQWDPEKEVFTATFTPQSDVANGVEKAYVQVEEPDGKVEVVQLYLRVL